MGKQQQVDDNTDIDDDFEFDGDIDLSDLVSSIHYSEFLKPSRKKGKTRNARRRLDELAYEKALREELFDPEDDYFYNH